MTSATLAVIPKTKRTIVLIAFSERFHESSQTASHACGSCCIVLNTKRPWNELPRYGVLAVVVSLMLVEWLRGVPVSPNFPQAFQAFRAEIIGLTLEKTFQTGGVIILFLYHLFLLWIKAGGKRLSREGRLPWWKTLDSRDWCKLFLVLCAVGRYAATWDAAPVIGDRGLLISGVDQSTNVLVFLAGIVVSQILEMLVTRNNQSGLSVGQFTLIALVVFLAVASLTQHEGAFKFKYRGENRATGLWVNPNTYGLLMGVGLVLALAYLNQASRLIPRNPSNKQPDQNGGLSGGGGGPKWAKWLSIVLAGVGGGAAVLLVAGLIRSYSRGAWLATLVGSIYLLVSTFAWVRPNDFEKGWSSRLIMSLFWLRRNVWVGAVLCISLFLLVMFHSMHSDHLLVKRAVSAANANDFSWRYRLVAWEGALQIIAGHPTSGVGWHRIHQEFEQFYAPPQLTEHLSIILNDYLTLGMAVGIPALACFMALVWISLHDCRGGRVRQEWIVTASRSALIVLLIGFWFDGGLFKLALAAPFWLFLEIGVPREHDNNEI